MTTILLILRNLPAALSLLATMTTILKSDEVKEFLSMIRETVKKIKETPVEPTPVEAAPAGAPKLFERFKNLLAQRSMNLSDREFAAMQRNYNFRC